MSKRIKCSLNQKSIQNAIDQLKSCQNELKSKNELFVKRLSELGLEVVQSTIESIPDEEKGSYYTEIINDKQGNIIGSSIRLSGNNVLFIEFSAGITYGTNVYPLSSGNSYGMGTYPSKKEKSDWDNPNGWWYTDESVQPHHSYGNRAYMPMYHAEQAVIIAVRKIAKEVFG